MTVAPGQRWRMPSGKCWQVVRHCRADQKEDCRNVIVAPVIDGVLISEPYQLEEFTCSYLSRFGALVR